MTKNAVLLVAMGIAVLTMSGCPGANQFVGTWTVTINMLDYGLELNRNGTATAFALDGLFTGTVTWEANGDMLTIYRDTGTDRIAYIGLVINGATTGGWTIWIGPGTGTGGEWSAVKQ